MDVLLVNPNAVERIYGELGNKLTAIEPPLWCRLIAGYLIDRGWEVDILDMEAEDQSALGAARQIIANPPRLVAICAYGHQPSASTQQMAGTLSLGALLINQAFPVAVLGDHPSALPVETLETGPFDYVIDGEGPVTLDGLLRGDALPTIPGLVYRVSACAENGTPTIRQNKTANLINLEELHGNAWHLLPNLSEYRAHIWQVLDGSIRSPYASVYTSLGCSYKCDFCMINVFQHTNRYRMRDPYQVVEEIYKLYNQGVQTFKIVDELFVLNKNHYREVCRLLAQANLDDMLNIWCYARPDTVDADDLHLMRDAGIKWLALGIESGSPYIRILNRKNLRMDANASIRQTVQNIKDGDINVIGNYIFGLPEDTSESMEATLQLALELNTEWANFYCAMPYPGSPLYERVRRTHPEDLPPSWTAYSQHNRYTYPLRNAHLSAAEILRYRDYAFKVYFTAPTYIKMIEERFGPSALGVINEMLKHDLERDILTPSGV